MIGVSTDYPDGWVLALTPFGPEWDDRQRESFEAFIDSLGYAGPTPGRSSTDAKDLEGRREYKASVGMTLAFKGGFQGTVPSDPAVDAKSRTGALQGVVHRTDGTCVVMCDFRANTVAEDSLAKRAIHSRMTFYQRSGVFEDLRAVAHVERGALVLTLGESSPSMEWDVRVDGQGASVRVGNRAIALRHPERPTIVIGGNRTDKPSDANKEPLQVLRIEGNGPPPADGRRTAGKP